VSLAFGKRVLPETHPDIGNAMGNLANSYSDLDRHAEAVQLLEETLAFRKRVLPETHPDIGAAMSDLAILYENLGQNVKALQSHEAALVIFRRALPQGHPRTVQSLVMVARLRVMNGQLVDAAAAAKEVLPLLPPEHPAEPGLVLLVSAAAGSTPSAHTRAVPQSPPPPPPKFTPLTVGARVILRGIASKPELNGRCGPVTDVFANGRYGVALDGASKPASFKLANLLQALPTVELAAPAVDASGSDRPARLGTVDGWNEPTTQCRILLADTYPAVELLASPAALIVPAGTVVRIAGLVGAAEHNGKVGQVGQFDRAAGRYEVVLERPGGVHIKVRPRNVAF
jgi:tetratricopeptide (TPR) repeat protein